MEKKNKHGKKIKKMIDVIGIKSLKEGIDFVWEKGLRVDAKESDPRYKDIIYNVGEDVCNKIEGCEFIWFYVWVQMKEELKKEHGIDWLNPAELNPEECFFQGPYATTKSQTKKDKKKLSEKETDKLRKIISKGLNIKEIVCGDFGCKVFYKKEDKGQ